MAAANKRRMNVDQVFNAKARVDERFDGLNAVALDIAADPMAMIGHFVHHFPIGLAEPMVVFEEVAVPVHVGHHQLLVHQCVGTHQVGIARIVIDDELVDLLQPVRVALGELFVLHAETPMRVAGRKTAQRGDGVQVIGVDDLEDGGKEIQTIAASVAFHLLLNGGQVGRQRLEIHGGHMADLCPFLGRPPHLRRRTSFLFAILHRHAKNYMVRCGIIARRLPVRKANRSVMLPPTRNLKTLHPFAQKTFKGVVNSVFTVNLRHDQLFFLIAEGML